jgi:hypothetical protein
VQRLLAVVVDLLPQLPIPRQTREVRELPEQVLAAAVEMMVAAVAS